MSEEYLRQEVNRLNNVIAERDFMIDRYKKALEEYGNPDNWDTIDLHGAHHDFRLRSDMDKFGPRYRKDGWIIAQQALKEAGDE